MTWTGGPTTACVKLVLQAGALSLVSCVSEARALMPHCETRSVEASEGLQRANTTLTWTLHRAFGTVGPVGYCHNILAPLAKNCHVAVFGYFKHRLNQSLHQVKKPSNKKSFLAC